MISDVPMEVPGVLGTPDTSQADATSATMSTTIPGGTVGAIPKPVLDAIMYSIAYNICSYSNQSQQRIHDLIQESQSQ